MIDLVGRQFLDLLSSSDISDTEKKLYSIHSLRNAISVLLRFVQSTQLEFWGQELLKQVPLPIMLKLCDLRVLL